MRTFYLLLVTLLLLTGGCTPLTEEVTETSTNARTFTQIIDSTDLSPTILNYLATHYSDRAITQTLLNNQRGNITYEVTLDSGESLLFGTNGHLLAISQITADDLEDADGTFIYARQLPVRVLNFIAERYPGAIILFAEREATGYEVYLSTEVELHFDEDGVFIALAYDNDDDGLDTNSEEEDEEEEESDDDDDDGTEDDDDTGTTDDDDG